MPEPTELPFTAIDEGIYHIEAGTTPWNIQVELGAHGRLDLARLREAVRAACERHVLTRASMRPAKATEKHYTWMIGEASRKELVDEVDCPDGDVAAARAAFYSPDVPLEDPPLLRVRLVRRPTGDLMMMSVSHVMADGVGTMRILHSITRAYRGVEDPEDPVSLDEARDLYRTLEPTEPGERSRRRKDNLGMLRDGLRGPARIAVETSSAGDGFGFAARRLSPEVTRRLVSAKPEGSTLNDVFLAALHLTIDRWNGARNQRTKRVVLMMPFNIRPTDRFHEVVSNIVTFVNLGTEVRHRGDFQSTLAEVSRQSRSLKQARGAGLHDLAALGRNLPVGLKLQASKLLPLTGNRFIATAVLSNLGRLPETPSFEDDGGSPTELWFSPPCAMPLGVGVGVATLDDAIHLMVRYRREQFDVAAGEAFADLLVGQLSNGST